jgi:hypothetical protein
MRRFWSLVLVVPILAVAACGSDSSSGSRSDDEAATKAAIAAFERDLQADGFKADPDAGDDEGGDDLHFDGAECKGLEDAFGTDDDEALPGSKADADSRPLKQGTFDGTNTETDVEASVAVLDDADAMAKMFDTLRGADVEGCLQQALDEEFTGQAAQEDVAVTGLDVDVVDLDGVGDDALDMRISAAIDVGVGTFPFVIDLAVTRAGDHAASVVLTTLGADEAELEVGDLLGQLLGHLDTAA